MMALVMAFAAASACLPVEGESIMAGDLARADARFASMDAGIRMAYAPAPGARRVFLAAELSRIARQYGVQAEGLLEACFERAAAPLDPAKLAQAMRAVFEQAQIKIADYSRYPAPAGTIEFPRSGLMHPSPADNGAALWKGWVAYGSNRRFPIWAKVRLKVKAERVVARETLAAGETVAASKLKVESVEGFPGAGAFAQSIEQAAGRVLKHAVRAGDAVTLDALEDSKEVMRGDVVSVEVRSGAATLKLEGRAEAAGRTGETVRIRNTATGRTFLAEVTGRDAVLVTGDRIQP